MSVKVSIFSIGFSHEKPLIDNKTDIKLTNRFKMVDIFNNILFSCFTLYFLLSQADDNKFGIYVNVSNTKVEFVF